MKNSVKYLLVLLIAAAGCTQKTTNSKEIQKQIEAKADACKDTAKCTINVADLTDFKWETMYVFNSAYPKDIIEQAIGTTFPGYQEGMHPMIFMDKGVIVYYENNPNGLAPGSPGQIIFSFTVGLHYWAFKPNNANFRVKIEKTKGKVFYEMFQAQ